MQRSEVNRNPCCEQFSAVGRRTWPSSALVTPTKTLNTDLAPVGDDIEATEVPREDVELRKDEDAEPLEAEVPRANLNPSKYLTSREKQEIEDSGRAVYKSWCVACVEGLGVGGQHRTELLNEEERERTTPIVAVHCGFMTQDNADTFFHSDLSRQYVWSNWSDML